MAESVLSGMASDPSPLGPGWPAPVMVEGVMTGTGVTPDGPNGSWQSGHSSMPDLTGAVQMGHCMGLGSYAGGLKPPGATPSDAGPPMAGPPGPGG